jgi:hypothetical protein
MELTFDQKIKTLKDPDCSVEQLEKFADDEYWGIRLYVAVHPKCSPKLLEKLADDVDWIVRSYVAQHPNCSLKLLEKLANDEDCYVRCIVTEHPNCSLKLRVKHRFRQFALTLQNDTNFWKILLWINIIMFALSLHTTLIIN